MTRNETRASVLRAAPDGRWTDEVPTKPRTMAIVATTEREQVALERERREEARKPTAPRIGLALPAKRMLALCSSSRSSSAPARLRERHRGILVREDPAHDEHHDREPQRTFGAEQVLDGTGSAATWSRSRSHQAEPRVRTAGWIVGRWGTARSWQRIALGQARIPNARGHTRRPAGARVRDQRAMSSASTARPSIVA